MPDIIAVFNRWWKWITAITVLSTIVAVVIVLLLPKRFVSIATALPASSFAADKSTIFNPNIQELYSALGTADDLDRIIGTARLDTIYIATVNELNLAAHYGLKKNNAKEHAVQKLKRHTVINKSEWGELKIKAWDSDRNYAARLANTLLQNLQNLHQSLRNQSNQLVLQKLKETYQLLQQTDTTAKKTAQPAQSPVYEKLLSEYSLMVAANPPVLLVVEAARPALYADNSEKWASVLVAFFAALIFSFLLALYTEGKKDRA